MSDKNRIRLELELTRVGDPGLPLVNLFTGGTPVFPRSRAIQVELVLLEDGALDANVLNISNVLLEVKAYNSPTTAPIISRNVIPPEIIVITDDQRSGRSSQHVLVELPAGTTAVDMAGADSDNTKAFSLVVTATRNGNLVTIADGVIRFRNDGGQYTGNAPIAGDPTFYTADQINGMLQQYLKQDNEPGKVLILRSENGVHARKRWVTDDGVEKSDPVP